MSTTLTTDFNVNNENYANKDLSKIFSPASAFGFKYIYEDFLQDLAGGFYWDFYGSGSRSWDSGSQNNPGQYTLTTASGNAVSGVLSNFYIPPTITTVQFICKANTTVDSSTILIAGLSRQNDVSAPSVSAYIGLSSGTFCGYINGVVVSSSSLLPWVANIWYLLEIVFNQSDSTITFNVKRTDGISSASFTSGLGMFSFNTLYKVIYELRISASKTFDLDYIGTTYIASR